MLVVFLCCVELKCEFVVLALIAGFVVFDYGLISNAGSCWCNGEFWGNLVGVRNNHGSGIGHDSTQ